MRQDEAFKENRRPPGMARHGEQQQCSDLLRRPLGERRACNKRDLEPCIKWLQGTVARSRVVVKDASPTKANAPPVQPSCSPDIIRKKSSRDLDACFGMGPTVKGDVKDRRKSKPRALLTVDVHKELVKGKAKGIPKPGRASLEWISDDPDDSTSDSGTSGGSSCTVQPWETPSAIHTYGNTDAWQQAWYLDSLSAPSDADLSSKATSEVLSSDVDSVVGAYVSTSQVASTTSSSTVCSPTPNVKCHDEAGALHKLTLVQLEKNCGAPSTSISPNSVSFDSLSEQVRSLQMELKGLLRSESWK